MTRSAPREAEERRRQGASAGGSTGGTGGSSAPAEVTLEDAMRELKGLAEGAGLELAGGYLTNGHSVSVERRLRFRIAGHAETGLSYPTGVMLFRVR